MWYNTTGMTYLKTEIPFYAAQNPKRAQISLPVEWSSATPQTCMGNGVMTPRILRLVSGRYWVSFVFGPPSRKRPPPPPYRVARKNIVADNSKRNFRTALRPVWISATPYLKLAGSSVEKHFSRCRASFRSVRCGALRMSYSQSLRPVRYVFVAWIFWLICFRVTECKEIGNCCVKIPRA